MKSVMDRFLTYVTYDTKSNPDSSTTPSTESQLLFGDVLVQELKELGLTDIEKDENGYIYATLEANTKGNIPTIAFIAHMDTSPDFSGTNVKPQVIDYTGGDIVLNEEKNIILSPADFPSLNQYVNQQLITTDGTTLLGADDKAGIAEIMTAINYLIEHPEIKHGCIKVAFTPDEEIGRGADKFQVEKTAHISVGLELDGTIDYREQDYKGKIAVVVGSEGRGISKLVKENCDFLVRIPMYGKVNSLNASVSAGLLLYQILTSRGL